MLQIVRAWKICHCTKVQARALWALETRDHRQVVHGCMKVAKLPNTFVLFKSLLSGQMIVMISPRLRRKHERFKIIGGTLAGLLFVNHDVSTSSAFIIQPSLVSPGLTAMSDATAPWRAGKRSHLIMSTATSEITAQELLEPPKDDTFTVRGALNEFRTSVEASPQRARKFEVLGGKTGGIWRSRILGFLPATVRLCAVLCYRRMSYIARYIKWAWFYRMN